MAQSINEFIDVNFTRNCPVVIASGVYEHEEFVKLVDSVFYKSKKNSELTKINKKTDSKFISNQTKILCENEYNYAILSFEGAKLNTIDYIILELLRHLIQIEAIDNNKKSSSIANKILKGINFGFNDTGIFGFNIIAQAPYASSMLEVIYKKIEDITKATDEILLIAKRNYKLEIIRDLNNPSLRLENIAKAYVLTGKIFNANNLFNQIESITANDIKKSIYNLSNSKPNLLYLGRNIDSIAHIDQIEAKIKSKYNDINRE